jgi:predicted patatin/cPLA2 family phospholipase
MINRGLVLEGGGLWGIYTAGVLDAFLEGGVQFPYIIGVSAGAGMGASFASSQPGRNLAILKTFRLDKRYISIGSLIRTGNLFGLDFIYHDIPLKLIPFDFEAFNKYPGRFVTVCTDCETGRAAYFEKDEGDMMTVLKASAAMPFVSTMVKYKGKKYFDGAIADAIPIQKTIAEGFHKTVVVLTRPGKFRRKEEPHPPGFLFYRKYPKLLEALKERVASYNRSMVQVEAEEEAGRALVIRPSRDLGVTRTEKNLEKLIALYDLGIADGREALKKLK